MRRLARLIFWLSLILLMMPLFGCSTPASCNTGCIAWPVGGKPVADVYRKLTAEDRAVMNEWLNRLYKVRQLPAFCQ
uniref:SurA N-terminal domain n=1 Tax=Myoviridae sp. ct2AC8 TaxID=2827655 RepID=A0A8S5TPX0_9CAUD|nr:MAG TPA: SurA N-terminal domain [Myoviridae sp. ct2AC8]